MVDYRHLVVTLPKKMGLRKRFQLDTHLHRQVGRVIHRVITRWMAVQSFGAGLRSHVPFHILVTDGVFFPEGDFYALGFWDQPSLLTELRQAILRSLVARKCLQPETAEVLESWPLERSGFSAFVGSPINQPSDRSRLERVLRYIFRPPLPMKYLSWQKAATRQLVSARKLFFKGDFSILE